MSGDGGNPPSLRDLLGAYEKSGLALNGEVIGKHEGPVPGQAKGRMASDVISLATREAQQ